MLQPSFETLRDFSNFLDSRTTLIRDSGQSLPLEMLENYVLMPNQFMYVNDQATNKIVYHRGLEHLFGKGPFHINGLTTIYERIHPDDLPTVTFSTICAMRVGESCYVKPFGGNLIMDYRTKNAEGSYIRILRNSTMITTSETGYHYTLAVCTFIEDIKPYGKPGFAFKGAGENIFTNMVAKQKNTALSDTLSTREKHVLQLIAKGKSSREIADKLSLSLHTINTHRKNILRKSNYRNMSALIAGR